jgi:hypothetical protein
MMLVVPDAAMKIAAERYAQRAGYGGAVAIGMVTGFHSLNQGEDQESVAALRPRPYSHFDMLNIRHTRP